MGEFLSRHLNPRLSPAEWAASIVPPWVVDSPNHGFRLVEGEELVGVHLAFYSRRLIDGTVEDFCNLGAWCVLEPHRSQGIRMLRALLAQPGYSFTDLSPSGAVVPLNQRLRFSSLDTDTVLVPARPLPWPRRTRVIDDLDVIESRLSGAGQGDLRGPPASHGGSAPAAAAWGPGLLRDLPPRPAQGRAGVRLDPARE